MARFESAPKDPLGRHFRVYREVLDSAAWLALSFSAQALYVTLGRELGATNNGNISAPLSTMKHRGFRSAATLSKGLRELSVVGLIAKTRDGGLTPGGKQACLYRFTHVEMHEFPALGLKPMKATHDYRAIKELGLAKRLIRIAHLEALRPETQAKLAAKKNAARVQKLNRLDADSESKVHVLRFGN